MDGLGRILASETNVSDLLAFFTEEDPGKWEETLGRVPSVVERETRSGTPNRADLVLRDTDKRAIAAVEVKLGHHLSPAQASWYESTFDADESLILATLDPVPPDVIGDGTRWTLAPLPELIGQWVDSSVPEVAAIAAASKRVLSEWSLAVTSVAIGQDARSADVLSTVTEPFLARVLTRALAPAVVAEGADATWSGVTSGGGNALLQCWRQIAGRPEGQYVMAEVRWSPAGRVMDFRFGVDVDRPETDIRAGREAAWELAQALDDAIRVDTFRDYLCDVDPHRGELLTAPSRSRPSGRPTAKGDWSEIVERGFLRGDAKSFNPGFYRDGDMRFEASTRVDTSRATGPDVVALLGHSLRFLEHRATPRSK